MGLIFVLVTTSNFLTHIFPTGYKVILKTPTFRTTTIVSYTKQTLPNTQIKMKWLYVIASVALFASAYAYETEEEGEARLGYISVASGGDTSLTFNATSIQNAVILGLFLLVLGALLLPL